MQTLGCVTLGQLCENVVGLPAVAVLLGAPTVIISALRTFPDSSVVQAYACRALAAALPAEPTADDDAQHAGVMSCIVDALRAHGADANVQRHACLVLYRLMKYQLVNAFEAWRLGAFPVLCEDFRASQPAA